MTERAATTLVTERGPLGTALVVQACCQRVIGLNSETSHCIVMRRLLVLRRSWLSLLRRLPMSFPQVSVGKEVAYYY